MKEKMVKHLKSFNNFVSTISSYTIFLSILLYLFGMIIKFNLVEDDLLLNEIKRQMPKNSVISSIQKDDIHGFGNDTIVVSAVNQDHNFNDNNQSPNQLFIYDKVENDIMKSLYRPLGIGSSYHMKYRLSLDKEGEEMLNDLDNVTFAELTGDTFKEVVATFKSVGGSDGVDFPCIISWIDGSYKVIGSFPNGYFDYLESIEPLKLGISESDNLNLLGYYNTYNKNEKMNLNGHMSSFGWTLMDIGGDKREELIISAWKWGEGESRPDAHFYRIDIYEPNYEIGSTNPIEWNLIFSKGTSEKIKNYCDMEYIKEFISKHEGEILKNLY